MNKNTLSTKKALVLSLVMMAVLVLSACAPAATPAPTQDMALIQTQAAQTVVADITQERAASTDTSPAPDCSTD